MHRSCALIGRVLHCPIFCKTSLNNNDLFVVFQLGLNFKFFDIAKTRVNESFVFSPLWDIVNLNMPIKVQMTLYMGIEKTQISRLLVGLSTKFSFITQCNGDSKKLLFPIVMILLHQKIWNLTIFNCKFNVKRACSNIQKLCILQFQT